MLADTVTYAKQRRQFGREIGSYQAIKHQLADVRIALDFARPLVFGAALDPTPRAVSAAKVLCADAAYLASRTGLQVHGAIGYTSEFDLSIWITKIRALVTAWGTPAFHRARILESLSHGGLTWSSRSARSRRSSPRPSAQVLTKQADSAAVRAAIASEEGYDAALWSTLCEQVGVAALAIPEEYDGAGATFFETAVVLEEIGRSLAPTPLLASVLAAEALLAGGTDDAKARLLPRIAAGEIATLALGDGPVLDGDHATIVLAVDGDQLVELTGATATWAESMDQTIRLARLDRSGATATVIGDGVAARARAELVGPAAAAALAVGLCDRALRMTVDYSKERVQFGRPIGSFQALKHRMADMLARLEIGRSASWAASYALATDATDAERADPHRGVVLPRGRRPPRRRVRPAARRHRDHLGARRPPGVQARPRAGPALRRPPPAPGRPHALISPRQQRSVQQTQDPRRVVARLRRPRDDQQHPFARARVLAHSTRNRRTSWMAKSSVGSSLRTTGQRLAVRII